VSCGAYRNAVKCQLVLDTSNSGDSVVNDAGNKRGVGMASLYRRTNVTRRPGTAARDHRNIDSIGDRCRQVEIVTGASTVAIDTRYEQFSGSPLNALVRPSQRIEWGWRSTSSRIHLPAITIAFGIDARNNALRSEPFRTL